MADLNKKLEQMKRLKGELERLKEAAQENEAEKKHLLKVLKEEFKCNSIEDIQRKLKQLRKEKQETEEAGEEEMEELLTELKEKGIMK